MRSIPWIIILKNLRGILLKANCLPFIIFCISKGAKDRKER